MYLASGRRLKLDEHTIIKWMPSVITVVGWVVTLAVMWTKTRDQLDSHHGRIDRISQAIETHDKNIIGLEHDVSTIAESVSRIEKAAVETVKSVNEMNAQMNARDVRTQVRLAKIEARISRAD